MSNFTIKTEYSSNLIDHKFKTDLQEKKQCFSGGGYETKASSVTIYIWENIYAFLTIFEPKKAAYMKSRDMQGHTPSWDEALFFVRIRFKNVFTSTVSYAISYLLTGALLPKKNHGARPWYALVLFCA